VIFVPQIPALPYALKSIDVNINNLMLSHLCVYRYGITRYGFLNLDLDSVDNPLLASSYLLLVIHKGESCQSATICKTDGTCILCQSTDICASGTCVRCRPAKTSTSGACISACTATTPPTRLD